MPLCWTCIRQVQGKMGKTFVGAGDVQQAGFLDDVPGPYGLGKKVGGAARENLPDPYAMGHEAGTELKQEGTGTVGKVADAGKEVASTIKTLAIVGGIFGGAFLLFSFYRAHKASQHALATVQQHPEMLLL